MSDFITLGKPTYAMGEPISFTYDLTQTIASYGAVQLVLMAQDGQNTTIYQSLNPATGPQSATFTFTEAKPLPLGDYFLKVSEFGGQQFEAFNADFGVVWTDGWTSIGTGISGLVVAEGDRLYGIEAGTNNVMAYSGEAGQWTSISGPVTALAGNDDALYAIDAGKTSVQLYGGGAWKPVGPPVSLVSIVAAGESLYGLRADGEVFGFDGSSWVDLGQHSAKLVVNRTRLFSLTPAKDQVLMLVDGSSTWTPVGGAMVDVIAADNALLGVDAAGNLNRWTGNGTAWETIGVVGAGVVARGTLVLGVRGDRSGVFAYSYDTGSWVQTLGAADSVVIGDNFIYGLRGSSVLLYEYDGAPLPLTSTASPPPAARTALQQVGTSVNTGAEWIFSFQTADEAFAGFDGWVKLNLILASVWSTNWLPIKHFVRGGRYVFPIRFGLHDLTSISLQGEGNFFGETWHVDEVQAYHVPTGRLFTFAFNCEISLYSGVNRTPTSVVANAPAPGAVLVRIWERGVFSPWGHAALTLSDGTHISWWPAATPRARMPFLEDVYSAPPNPDQTFDDDMELECDANDPLCVNGKRPPDIDIALWRLDEAKIKVWWADFKTKNQWKTLSQNCSTTVYDALCAGVAMGLLTTRQQDNYKANVVWTPENITQLAGDLLAAP